ncbi:hypothetical protein GXW82_39615 [Streptacidiphilus sp. 4-A2]|nr:hypothetical protein [Streptacidiphilus sp. 4-A2]
MSGDSGPDAAVDAPAPEETGDWTDETLDLLRALRAPHRRSRAGQIGYAVYSFILFVLSWGGLSRSACSPRNASMGANYTADGPRLLAALPAGCARSASA